LFGLVLDVLNDVRHCFFLLAFPAQGCSHILHRQRVRRHLRPRQCSTSHSLLTQYAHLLATCWPGHFLCRVQQLLRRSRSWSSQLRGFSWLLTHCYLFLIQTRLLRYVFVSDRHDPKPQGLTAFQLAQRILVSFILYSLYAPHPVTINPFKSALFVVYVKEREKAVHIANEGGVSPNEQFVWVLWKILKGDGNDVSGFDSCGHETSLTRATSDWTLLP